MGIKKLILGSGKVASIFYSLDRENTVVVSRRECDITHKEEILSVIEKHSPSIIINCAARTNLEYCEEYMMDALCVNTMGAVNVLNTCSEKNIKFVHISSGCLFDGNDVVSTEESIPTPGVWYTWTKKWADEAITSHSYKDVLILRPRQLVSSVAHPSNLITKFLGFKEISAIDELNSITCIEDLFEMMEHLLSCNATGVFNCANTEVVTPYEISLMIKEYINPALIVKKISYDKLLAMLPNRRVNTVLSVEKLMNTGYTPRTAKEAIVWCLENYEK